MSKPTLVQTLLNLPSQSYSLPAKKDYYSTRQEMMRLATSSVASQQAAKTPHQTSQSMAPSMPATTPKPPVHSRDSPPTPPHNSQPKNSSAKSTLSSSSSRPSSTVVSRPNSTTATLSQTAQPQKSPRPQAIPLQPRLSYVDRYDSDSDSEGDQSNLEAYFTPNTSPRTSMASSITFPSGTRRKSSRKSLKTDDKPGGPSGSSTPRMVAVPSTRTPSSSSDKARALHALSINSSLSSNSLDAHSMFSDWVGSGEPTPMTTPIQSEDGRQGKSATPKAGYRSTSTSTTATTTPISAAARGKNQRPTNGTANDEWAQDVRRHVAPSGSDTKRRNSNNKNNNGTLDSTKARSTVAPTSPPATGSTVTKTPAKKHNLGDTLGLPPPSRSSAKGKEKEGQPARPRQAHHHGSAPAKPAILPAKSAPHTFSAFAPIATSSPPATINKPAVKTPSPEPAQASQMTISLPPPNRRERPTHSKPVTMANMSALLEEDEDAPFTPRMEGHDLLWSGDSNGSSPGRNRTLRHTSGTKARPELHRRRSRSLESTSSRSGSASGSTSTLKKQPKTLTSEVQALSLATPGERPSKGTQGYTSLVLPRAPPSTSAQPQNDGWGRWFSSVSSMTDGKVDLTRSGVAQTTMASVEVVKGLGATRKGALGGVLNVLAAGRRRLSSGSGAGPPPISLPGNNGRRASKDNVAPAGSPPDGSGAEGMILGFTSYRKPPSYVPSSGVLVQIWAVGVDEIDGRLVGVKFGAGERSEEFVGGDQEVEEPEEIQTEDEQRRGAPDESQDEDAAPTKRGLAGLGRTLSIRGKMMLSLSGNSANKSKKDLQRSASEKQVPPQISTPQPHKRSTSFNLKRNNTTVSTATAKTNASGASQLQRNPSVTSAAGRRKKQSYAGVGYIPGRSFVGRVLECGWEVKDEVVRKGEWVVGLLDVRKCGALAEFIVVDRHRLHRVPHPRQAASNAETPPIPIWAASPTSPQGIMNPPTLTLEELALVPLCGLPAYRAVRTFTFAFSSVRDGSSTPAAVDLRAGLEFGTAGGIPSARITTDHDQGHRRRALVLRGHDGPGAMAVQMLVQRGWQVSVHVPLSALPSYATYDQEEAYKTSAEERARTWGADEVIFDDGEVGDNDGRGAATRVLDSLREEGDVFDAILDTIGGKEIREAGEKLLRSAGGPMSPPLSEGPASPAKGPKKQTQFTTLVGDAPDRTIPSAGDNFRAGLRSLRFVSNDTAAGSPRKNSEDVEGKSGGKVGYAWVSVAQDVDWEGKDVGETLGTVLQMALEDGVRPWVGEEDGRELVRPRVVPFEKAPRAFVEGGPLGDGGTVVVKIAG